MHKSRGVLCRYTRIDVVRFQDAEGPARVFVRLAVRQRRASKACLAVLLLGGLGILGSVVQLGQHTLVNLAVVAIHQVAQAHDRLFSLLLLRSSRRLRRLLRGRLAGRLSLMGGRRTTARHALHGRTSVLPRLRLVRSSELGQGRISRALARREGRKTQTTRTAPARELGR